MRSPTPVPTRIKAWYGFERADQIAYSAKTRLGILHIPQSPAQGPPRRSAFPIPDGKSVLASHAMMMAGLDGVQKQDYPRGPDRQEFVRTCRPRKQQRCRIHVTQLDQGAEKPGGRACLPSKGGFLRRTLSGTIELKMAEVTRSEWTTHPVEFDSTTARNFPFRRKGAGIPALFVCRHDFGELADYNRK